jgi:preprotein translocase subunit Sec61beta
MAGLGAFFIQVAPSCALEGTEYQIKGAMMVNFIKFVEWPESAASSGNDLVIIGIIGEDDFGETLEHIDGRIIGGKRLAVRHFDFPADLEACQILFVSKSEAYRTMSILDQVAGTPVLTIGETDGFTRLGGMIRFFLEKSHVRFEINPDAAAHAGLKFNAKLLEIARLME